MSLDLPRTPKKYTGGVQQKKIMAFKDKYKGNAFILTKCHQDGLVFTLKMDILSSQNEGKVTEALNCPPPLPTRLGFKIFPSTRFLGIFIVFHNNVIYILCFFLHFFTFSEKLKLKSFRIRTSCTGISRNLSCSIWKLVWKLQCKQPSHYEIAEKPENNIKTLLWKNMLFRV